VCGVKRQREWEVGSLHDLTTEDLTGLTSWEGSLHGRLYANKTAEEIAERLGRAVPATKRKIIKLGLRKRLRYEERHRVVDGVGEKSCSRCGEWKDERLFSKHRNNKDGLAQWCKECSNEARRKQRS
jgi:hypothetical protein